MRHGAHDSGAGHWAQPRALSHHNDVCWHILSGRTWLIQQKSDRMEVILEAVYILSGAITTEEASLLFSHSGVPNKVTFGNVWLPEMHDAFVAPRP